MAIDDATHARIAALYREIHDRDLRGEAKSERMREVEHLLGGQPAARSDDALHPTQIHLADPAKQRRANEINQALLDSATRHLPAEGRHKQFRGAHDRAALAAELAGLLNEPGGAP